MPYIDIPIEATPSDMAEEAFAYLEEQIAGWLPSTGNLEAWLIEALAQLASELRALAALVPDSIFAYFGESILNLAPFPAQSASGLSTWTTIDNAGYTIDAGTLVAITPAAQTDTYAFAVAKDAVIPNGQTRAINVQLTAVEAGADASGITGTVEVLDPLDFVQSVTLDAPTSGGVDAEATDAYLSRLSDLMTLLSPRPILPQDFAVLAQRVPGVARATAIDLYNPGPPVNANCPRCVTVAVVDANGVAVSATVKGNVDATLQAQREVNFLVFVVDPSYTTIDVNFVAHCYPGYLPADVNALAIANVTAYLSAANWGVPPYGDTSARSWINSTTVRWLEVAQVINATDGVNYIDTLTINVSGSAPGTVDVPLTGAAPLPKPGAITGAIIAP